MKPQERKTYLGDGVYAQHDGYQVWLSTMRGDVEERIALDSGTLDAFFRYLERTFHAKVVIETFENDTSATIIADNESHPD